MTRPKCKTCPYYDADVKVPVYDPPSSGVAYFPSSPPRTASGGCRLQPHTTPHKTPDEWCGQHPQFDIWIEELRVTEWKNRHQEYETPTP